MSDSKVRMNNTGKDSHIPNAPETIQALIADLGSKDMSVRARACQALVDIGEPAVIPLVKALGDEREWVLHAEDICLQHHVFLMSHELYIKYGKQMS